MLSDEPLLFLSGGSQKGAFGGGYLDGWKQSGAFPSDFAVVTGVSTGSLQSIYAFTGDVGKLADQYFIEKERDLLNTYVSDGDLGLLDFVTIIRKGSVGDLGPLKDIIETNLVSPITDGEDLITRVRKKAYWNESAQKYDDNSHPRRMLLIAATSVDDGEAYAFDMSHLASRIDQHRINGNTNKAEHLIDCFSDVMLASSAVPMAAQPIFIDNTMYIDGGAKFAITTHRVSTVMGIDIPLRKDVYILINGQEKQKTNCKICGPKDNSKQHKPWSFIGLTERSIDLLTNQIKQFSIEKIKSEAAAENNRIMRMNLCDEYERLGGNANDPFYLFNCQNIEPGDGETLFNIHDVVQIESKHLTDPAWGMKGRDCKSYERDDKEALKPVEFHPNYMACLVEYGRKRGAAGWPKL